MGTYLIDSNTLIEYVGKQLPITGTLWLENLIDSEDGTLSIINWIEIFSYPAIEEEEKNRFEDLCERLVLLNVTFDIAERTALLRQKVKMKLPDAIIAATALVHRLTLVTNDTHDFKNVPGLAMVNPHDI
jgi:predicted nucleic acid-binding protein